MTMEPRHWPETSAAECPTTPLQLESAIAKMRTAMRCYEQALWDGNNTHITQTRRELALAIKHARRVGAYSARLTPDLATRIGAAEVSAA